MKERRRGPGFRNLPPGTRRESKQRAEEDLFMKLSSSSSSVKNKAELLMGDRGKRLFNDTGTHRAEFENDVFLFFCGSFIKIFL